MQRVCSSTIGSVFDVVKDYGKALYGGRLIRWHCASEPFELERRRNVASCTTGRSGMLHRNFAAIWPCGACDAERGTALAAAALSSTSTRSAAGRARATTPLPTAT